MDQHIYQVLLRLNPWITDLGKWPECTEKIMINGTPVNFVLGTELRDQLEP